MQKLVKAQVLMFHLNIHILLSQLWVRTQAQNKTCPFDPYAVYSKFPFSTFPPHLRIAEAKN
jgi:hypothetical protein